MCSSDLLAHRILVWHLPRIPLARRQWKYLPLALFGMWFSVDGIYWLYWSWRDLAALEMMRSGNAPASACLYALCAMIWLHDGTLREILRLKK